MKPKSFYGKKRIEIYGYVSTTVSWSKPWGKGQLLGSWIWPNLLKLTLMRLIMHWMVFSCKMDTPSHLRVKSRVPQKRVIRFLKSLQWYTIWGFGDCIHEDLLMLERWTTLLPTILVLSQNWLRVKQGGRKTCPHLILNWNIGKEQVIRQLMPFVRTMIKQFDAC